MSSLSRRNLQEFCRICLNSLVERSSLGKNGTVFSNFDLNSMPQLKKLLILFTSMDDTEEYPQKLCQLCFNKLEEFEEFRRTIEESAQKIEQLIKFEEPNEVTPNNDENESNDDDQLLIPELAAEWTPPEDIKTEPMDTSQPEIQIKDEIDSEYEENDSNCQFYEQNALSNAENVSNDSDKVDEVPSFGNELLFSASFQSYKAGKKTTPTRKRDRNKKSLKCPRCDKQVYKKVYLDAHIRAIHEGYEKPFLCSECQKCFTRYNQLHVHMQTNHMVAIKFVCGIAGCNATFKMNQTLETHRRVVHTDEQITTPFALEEIIGVHQEQLAREWELDHTCKQCDKKFSSKRALTEHHKRHSQIREHVCQVCGVAKVTKTELKTHMRTHYANLEKFKCQLCPQEFNHKNAISRHVRVVHEGERRFICNFCPRRFGTRHAKVSHERLHTGERPFKCDSCQKGFAQIEGLNSHKKNHDKSLRKHVCKYCALRFITKKNLIDHEQRHFGSKPYICTICSRGFFNRKDLDIHTKIHLEEDNNGEQPKNTNKRLSQRFVNQVKNNKSITGENAIGTPTRKSNRKTKVVLGVAQNIDGGNGDDVNSGDESL